MGAEMYARNVDDEQEATCKQREVTQVGVKGGWAADMRYCDSCCVLQPLRRTVAAASRAA